MTVPVSHAAAADTVGGVGSRLSRLTRRRTVAILAGAAGVLAGAATYRRFSAPHSAVVAGVTMHAQPLPATPLRFVDGSGAATSLAGFSGRLVLLNVWATWCPPCREEMPTLDRLQGLLGGPAFEVVTVSVDSEGRPVVDKFFRQIGIQHLKPYLDGFHEAMALVQVGIPLTLLFDAAGRELGRKTGPAQWDDPQVLALLRRHLPQSATGMQPQQAHGVAS
jgi:thiol-disulfide isomerase/thioredoxin